MPASIPRMGGPALVKWRELGWSLRWEWVGTSVCSHLL